MSKLDSQGLQTLVIEINKNINKKINSAIGGTIGHGVSYPTIINIDQWVLDDSLGEYKFTIAHGLGTQNLFVAMVDNKTKESTLANYRLIDDNTLEIYSASNEEIACNIINLNVGVQQSSAIIDDTHIGLGEVWSSEKVDKEIKNIKIDSNSITIVDSSNNFSEDKEGGKSLEDVLAQLANNINKLFENDGIAKKNLYDNIVAIRKML